MKLLLELLRLGLLMKMGYSFSVLILLFSTKIVPKLIRIGILDRNPSALIKSVSLEQMAEAELIQ